MNRIGVFLDNDPISMVDCSQIPRYNPGIGGTEYLIISIATLLSSRNNNLDITLYTTADGVFPAGLRWIRVSNYEEAMQQAYQDGCEALIFKHCTDLILQNTFNHCPTGLKLIVWCHVFTCYWELDFYAKSNVIFRIVYVGREMYDLYRDHKSFKKATYIYNCIDLADSRIKVQHHSFEKRANIVTYIGSITPFKGFHLLAKAWPKVIEQVPDAQLYVIGSGRLYDHNAILGKYGIAEQAYERKFIHYLTDNNNQILPNVHFMGVLGIEKYNILLKTKVGVPNPSGITETFGLSAVEMQMLGAVVTTKVCPGYIDTVINGKLYTRTKTLAKNIIDLLQSSGSQYEAAISYFEQHFSLDAVISKWELWLQNGCELPSESILPNKWYRLKIIKEILRRAKQACPLLYALPPLERVILFVEKMIGKYGSRYIDSNASNK